MWEIVNLIIAVYLVVNILIPAIVIWFVIRYIFYLRQKQNDQFLDDLGYVVHDAVLDALKDSESSKRNTKSHQANYIPKK